MLFFVAASANLKFAFEKYDPGFEWGSLYKKFQPANAVNSSENSFHSSRGLNLSHYGFMVESQNFGLHGHKIT